MKNKTVLVTGAAAGIGLAIATSFARQGAWVILIDTNANLIVSEVAKLRAQGLNVTGRECDVTSEAAIKAIIAEAYGLFGRIDILINNAGLQHIAPIETFSTEQFELMIKVMLTAPFVAIKHVFPIMKMQKFGRIINMASVNGLTGFAGKAAYNSAKHGLIGLTKVAALEGAEYGITVNAVCPGYVDTALVRTQLAGLAQQRNIPVEQALSEVIFPLVPQKRLLSVEEVASYVCYLAGEEAKGITGQAVVIDGGYLAQ